MLNLLIRLKTKIPPKGSSTASCLTTQLSALISPPAHTAPSLHSFRFWFVCFFFPVIRSGFSQVSSVAQFAQQWGRGDRHVGPEVTALCSGGEEGG